MKIEPSITIVILNFNRARDTINCVNSINDIDYINFKILLIDNCSTDNSVEVFTENLKDVEIVQTEKNLGYTGGVNFGLKIAQQSQADYILLINNDTIVSKTFLTELVSAMEKDKKVAVACGTILCEHNRKEIWYAGGRIIKWRGLAIHEGKGTYFNKNKANNPDYTTFVTGCLMLIRARDLHKIGLEDERFFMYLDDIELSSRIQRKGFKLLYVPTSIIYHKVFEKSKNQFMLYYSVRNRLLLISVILTGPIKLIAKTYFLGVITLKMMMWKIANPKFYKAAKCGLEDYFKKNFYDGRGFEFI